MSALHLVIPWAGVAEPAGVPPLPHLAGLLARLVPQAEVHGHWHLPHEHLRAAQAGWPHGPAADGLLPLAAHLACAAGLPRCGEPGWARVVPAHALVSAEQVTLLPPPARGWPVDVLDAAWAAAQPWTPEGAALYRVEGDDLHGAQRATWLLYDTRLATLPTASLARASGARVDVWQPPLAHARWLRRWQVELQMAWHADPLLAAQALAPNTVWVDGTGVLPELTPPQAAPAQWHETLAAPAQAGDGAAWATAFAALDAGPIAAAAQAHAAGQHLRLTLCGRQRARTWATPANAPGLLARLRTALRPPTPRDIPALLAELDALDELGDSREPGD